LHLPPSAPSLHQYHSNCRDEIITIYLEKGPIQPNNIDFPLTKGRRFGGTTFYAAHADWLEYSVAKDAVFCLFCYLFSNGKQQLFTVKDCRDWKKLSSKIETHIGAQGSAHRQPVDGAARAFREKHGRIDELIQARNNDVRGKNRIRLTAIFDVALFLANRGLPFRGHDESEDYSSTVNGTYLFGGGQRH
jgi:hypothetical protein